MNIAGNKRKSIKNRPETKQGTKSNPIFGPLDLWILKNPQKINLVDVITNTIDPTDNLRQTLEPPSKNDDKDAANSEIEEEEKFESYHVMQKEADMIRTNMTETQAPMVSNPIQKKKISPMDQLISDDERLGLVENEAPSDKMNLEQQQYASNLDINWLANHNAPAFRNENEFLTSVAGTTTHERQSMQQANNQDITVEETQNLCEQRLNKDSEEKGKTGFEQISAETANVRDVPITGRPRLMGPIAFEDRNRKEQIQEHPSPNNPPSPTLQFDKGTVFLVKAAQNSNIKGMFQSQKSPFKILPKKESQKEVGSIAATLQNDLRGNLSLKNQLGNESKAGNNKKSNTISNNIDLSNIRSHAQTAAVSESEKFPVFRVAGGVERLEINDYLEKLIKFVEAHEIYFTSDAEAERYFKKCDRRDHWRVGQEMTRILKVLRGLNIPEAVKDKEKALINFLSYEDPVTGERLDLTKETDYLLFSQFLKNNHTEDFELLREFLKSNPFLIAYMKSIIQVPLGYFPFIGSTQNVALWLSGKTKSGKTTLASIITSFLTVCKIRCTGERYTNSCGEGSIPIKAMYYNIFQLEELTIDKGPQDLMNLIDCGTSIIKFGDASGWGSDARGRLYHFPFLITSNYNPEAVLLLSGNRADCQSFCEAVLGRIHTLELSQSILPDLSYTNRFKVTPISLAQFVWAFVLHSPIKADWGELYPGDISNYVRPARVELSINELRLAPQAISMRNSVSHEAREFIGLNESKTQKNKSNKSDKLQTLLGTSLSLDSLKMKNISSSSTVSKTLSINPQKSSTIPSMMKEEGYGSKNNQDIHGFGNLENNSRKLKNMLRHARGLGLSSNILVPINFSDGSPLLVLLSTVLEQCTVLHRQTWVCHQIVRHDTNWNEWREQWRHLLEYLEKENLLPNGISLHKGRFACVSLLNECTPEVID